jgi:hypothetical protein
MIGIGLPAREPRPTLIKNSRGTTRSTIRSCLFRLAATVHHRRTAGRPKDMPARTPIGQLAAQRRLETQLRTQMAGRRLVAVSAQPTRDQLGLHVRLEFSDSSHSVWLHCTNTSASCLREAISTVGRSQRSGAIRLHLHRPESEKKKRTARECSRMLPTHVLTPAEVDLLGPAAACCICLEDFAAGNRVMVVPCAGLHKVGRMELRSS